MKQLIFIGSTGGCADLFELTEQINAFYPTFEILGALDDNYQNMPKLVYKVPILGDTRDLTKYLINENIYYATAIGNSKNFRSRELALSNLKIPQKKWATLIHPNANISRYARVGAGSIIHFGTHVGPSVSIGNNCLILPNCFIGHDTVIGDNVIINSGCTINGNTNIGDGCYIGAGSKMLDHISIARGSLIGMGSNVIRSCVAENSTLYGNPAKIISSI